MKRIKPERSKLLPRGPKVRLSWRAYFKSFCEEHGEPLELGGRLWFPDGWSYSSTDHKGPEWEPPLEPELSERLRAYWQARQAEALRQFKSLKLLVEGLQAQQRVRSAPLKRLVEVRDRDEQGNVRARLQAEGIDWQALTGRLELLADEALRCGEKLVELGGMNDDAGKVDRASV